MLTSAFSLFNLVLAGLAMVPAGGQTQCDDPVPIDIRLVTQELALKPFTGANQRNLVCHLTWEGESTSILMIFGPTWVAEEGHTFSSTKQAAAQYASESPNGAEPLPGVTGAYMVFNPATSTRRVFVEYGEVVYMIVSQDRVPVAVLAEAILG
jgi:hypothetical protein